MDSQAGQASVSVPSFAVALRFPPAAVNFQEPLPFRLSRLRFSADPITAVEDPPPVFDFFGTAPAAAEAATPGPLSAAPLAISESTGRVSSLA